MSRIPSERLLLAATLAVEEAREFFHLDPKWRINVKVDQTHDGNRGENEVRPEYFKSYITISEDLETPEDAYQVGAHEAAHLALAPLQMWQQTALERMPDAFRAALEQCTVTLEHMFLQAHPFPHGGTEGEEIDVEQ